MRIGDALRYLRDFGWNDVDAPDRRPVGSGPAGVRCNEEEAPHSRPVEHSESEPIGDPVQAPNLPQMAKLLKDCTRCRLSRARTQVVFGIGSPEARVMFVGEGPGADEDRLGEPFVGRAGQLLNAMLAAIGLARKSVYIANVVKCRPPGNRDPEAEEAAECLPFLRRQVELVNPEVLVTLGRVAALRLLGLTGAIRDYRGRWTRWEGRPVLPIFHPAYLLRNPAAKAQAWVDLKELRRRLHAGVSVD